MVVWRSELFLFSNVSTNSYSKFAIHTKVSPAISTSTMQDTCDCPQQQSAYFCRMDPVELLRMASGTSMFFCFGQINLCLHLCLHVTHHLVHPSSCLSIILSFHHLVLHRLAFSAIPSQVWDVLPRLHAYGYDSMDVVRSWVLKGAILVNSFDVCFF